MSNTAPQSLVISGVVFHGKTPFGSIGDVRLHPGANRTPYIDAYIFDGLAWRNLDLNSSGNTSRTFGGSGEIGAVMRAAEAVVKQRKGMPVYYERPSSGKRSRYVFRGVPLSTFLGPR